MKKRLLALVFASLTASSGLAVAQAAPGPNGNNDHGICTAYFNGQKKGHEQGDAPGPFAALEAMGDIQAIYDFCNAVVGNGNGGGNDGIGGNPDENGRFTDCFTDTNDDPSDDCTDG
jgi:hypothetical protein